MKSLTTNTITITTAQYTEVASNILDKYSSFPLSDNQCYYDHVHSYCRPMQQMKEELSKITSDNQGIDKYREILTNFIQSILDIYTNAIKQKLDTSINNFNTSINLSNEPISEPKMNLSRIKPETAKAIYDSIIESLLLKSNHNYYDKKLTKKEFKNKIYSIIETWIERSEETSKEILNVEKLVNESTLLDLFVGILFKLQRNLFNVIPRSFEDFKLNKFLNDFTSDKINNIANNTIYITSAAPNNDIKEFSSSVEYIQDSEISYALPGILKHYITSQLKRLKSLDNNKTDLLLNKKDEKQVKIAINKINPEAAAEKIVNIMLKCFSETLSLRTNPHSSGITDLPSRIEQCLVGIRNYKNEIKNLNKSLEFSKAHRHNNSSEIKQLKDELANPKYALECYENELEEIMKYIQIIYKLAQQHESTISEITSIHQKIPNLIFQILYQAGDEKLTNMASKDSNDIEFVHDINDIKTEELDKIYFLPVILTIYKDIFNFLKSQSTLLTYCDENYKKNLTAALNQAKEINSGDKYLILQSDHDISEQMEQGSPDLLKLTIATQQKNDQDKTQGDTKRSVDKSNTLSGSSTQEKQSIKSTNLADWRSNNSSERLERTKYMTNPFDDFIEGSNTNMSNTRTNPFDSEDMTNSFNAGSNDTLQVKKAGEASFTNNDL